MVTRNLFTALALLLPSLGYAAGFTAQVTNPHAVAGEAIDLHLELEGANAQAAPDLSRLREQFQVMGQSQSSTSRDINGVVSSSTGWDIQLLPKEEGPTQIPSVTIETDSGTLQSNALSIVVSEEKERSPARSHGQTGISFLASAGTPTPYQDERVPVTYELTSRTPLRNIQLGELTVKDAIVERRGEPKVENRVVSGKAVQTLKVSYFITPLKAGALLIPPLTLRAEAPAPRASARSAPDPFAMFGGDEDGPFAEMKQMMGKFMGGEDDIFSDFAPFKPVSLASSSVRMQVQPPVAGMEPWLPASDVKISEEWSRGEAQAGEPITRTVSIQTLGLSPSQIPSLENQMPSNSAYKVYVDPPTQGAAAGGSSGNVSQQTFTVIPQGPGSLTMPALHVRWWDVRNHVARTATLPAKTFSIFPGSSDFVSHAPAAPLTAAISKVSATKIAIAQTTPWTKAIAIFLAGIGALFALAYWWRKKLRLNATPPPVRAPELPRVEAINGLRTFSELNRFLQRYGEARWGALPNTPLRSLLALSAKKQPAFNGEQALQLVSRLEAALYAGQPEDLEQQKNAWRALLAQKPAKFTNAWKGEPLPELNPS